MEEVEIGADIEKISSFKDAEKNFLSKVFTKREIDYCMKKSIPEQHLAARFAAKEALIKALSQFGKKAVFKDIEILIKAKKPLVLIAKKLRKYKSKISLSHSGEYAIAFALVIKWKN